MEEYEVAIVGGGPAGYEAALTLKSLKHNFIWLGTEEFTNVRLSEEVRNFLSFSGRGEELSALLKKQAEREGISMTPARIDRIYLTGDKYLLTQGDKMYTAKTVILATGVSRKGKLKGEREFLGKGVSYCAVCDGGLYRGKKIAAIVESKEFSQEVEYLSGFAEKVYAFCDYEGASFSAKNVEILEERPLAVEGETHVEKIVFSSGEREVSGVFLLSNATPPSALVGGLKEEGDRVIVARDMSTNLKGLFAAGDVTGRPYQYIKAAGEGLVAAFSAHEYLLKAEKC